MTSRHHLQQRIAEAYAEAKAQGLTFDDIVPDEVQDHLQEELRIAREYAKEADERESAGQVKIAELEGKLKEAQEAVKNIPEDHEQRLQDLKIAINSKEFYQGLLEAAERDMKKLEEKSKAAIDKQMTIEENKLLILRLQEECQQHKTELVRLFEENNALRLQSYVGESKTLELLNVKENQVEELEKLLEGVLEREREQVEQIEFLEEEHERIQDVLGDLIDSLEDQTANVSDRLTRVSVLSQRKEQIHNTAISELIPLRRYYERYFVITKRLLQDSFTLGGSGTESRDILKSDLKFVSEEFEKLTVIREALADDVDDAMRQEIQQMGKLADDMQTLLISLVAYEHLSVRRPSSTLSVSSERSSTSAWSIVSLPKFGINKRVNQ